MNSAAKFPLLLFIFVILVPLLAIQSTPVKADSIPINPVIKHTITQPSPNVTYTNIMPLQFSYRVTYDDPTITPLGLCIYYTIDDGPHQSVPSMGGYETVVYIFQLSNGTHNVSAYVDAPYVYNDSIFANTQKLFSIDFAVLNYPPNITITSPLNKTYTTADIKLAVEVDIPATVEPYNNKLTASTKFSIDNKPNQTFSETYNLTGLAKGSHNLTVYADTNIGISSSKTIYFTVDETSDKTTTGYSNTLLEATAIGTVSVVLVAIVSVLIYQRHRKNNN